MRTRDNFRLIPMKRPHVLFLLTAVLATACAKEEPLLNATFHAKCRDCVVSYAGGVNGSRRDTLRGVPDGAGDTLAEEGVWKVEVKDGDNLFLRACRIHTDTAFGAIELWIDGDVRPISTAADTAADCAEINAPTHAR